MSRIQKVTHFPVHSHRQHNRKTNEKSAARIRDISAMAVRTPSLSSLLVTPLAGVVINPDYTH